MLKKITAVDPLKLLDNYCLICTFLKCNSHESALYACFQDTLILFTIRRCSFNFILIAENSVIVLSTHEILISKFHAVIFF